MIVFGPSLNKHQDLGRRWLIAYLKGARDYLKAFTTKEGRPEAISSLIKQTQGGSTRKRGPTVSATHRE